MNIRTSCLLALLAFPALAQHMDTANGPNTRTRTVSILDEIQDPQERSLFGTLLRTENPQESRRRAQEFAERYPRSVLLRETYELAARASAALGDANGALEWGQRALRLLPENPMLLTMVTDLAARRGEHQLADTSGRQALRYLERALPPTDITASSWPQVRNGLKNVTNFALGRTAEEQGRYEDAERWLLDALRSKPNDYVALYALGLARLEKKDLAGAAPCFAEVMKSAGGPIADAGRRRLREIFDSRQTSQTFEQFAASQRWVAPSAPSAPRAQTPLVYAGSESCRQCHAAEFRNWQATGMAKMFRPYSASEAMGRFSGEEILGGSARTSAENGQLYIELRNADSGKWVRYHVDALIGSKWQQAYASKLPDGRMVVLPIQYSKVKGEWVNFWKLVDISSERSDIGHFKDAPEGALYQRDCAPCHTSQLRYTSNGPNSSSAQFREGGINCEMCHGPSQAHVDAMRAGPRPAPQAASAGQAPVSFRKISAQQSVAICLQCHMQSLVYEPESGGAVNYSQTASHFYRDYSIRLLSDYSHKVFYADGRFRVTTFIGEAFERSRCYQEGGATCVSCHNPHPNNTADNPKSLKFAPDSNEMCVQCHQSLREHPERHTRHAANSEASKCVSCHMPQNMEALMFRARSHEIDEKPDAEMTARFGEADSPNACLSCHRDKDVRWLVESAAAWRSSR